MSDDKRKTKLSLEELLKASEPESFELTNEDREWLNTSVGKEVLDFDEYRKRDPKLPTSTTTFYGGFLDIQLKY